MQTRRFILTLVMGVLFISAPCLADVCEQASTQTELTKRACEKAHAADAELAVVYEALLAARADRPELVEKIKLAQVAWKNFRGAHLEILSTHINAGGSVAPM